MSRKSASASASSSWKPIRPPAVLDKIHKGQIVTCTVTAVQANGIEVKVDEVLTGFIRRAELARDKAEQRSERFAVGDTVDAKITCGRSCGPQAAIDDQGQGNRRGQAGGERIRIFGFRRIAG